MQRIFKIFITAVVLQLQFFFGYSQTINDFFTEYHSDKDNLIQREIKGKVKSLRTIYYSTGIDEETNKPYKLPLGTGTGFFEEFDSIGRLKVIAPIRVPVYFPIDKSDKTFFFYNVKGYLEKRVANNGNYIEELNSNTDVIRKTKIRYDKTQNNVYYDYKYNKSGKKTEVIEYASTEGIKNEKLKVTERKVYLYDAKGNNTITEIYGGFLNIMTANKKPVMVYHKFDINNNMIASGMDSTFGTFDVKSVYEGKKLVNIESKERNKTQYITFRENRIIKKAIVFNNGLKELRDYKYENDKLGNWIKIIITITESKKAQLPVKKDTITIEREIIYYDE